MNTPDSRRLLQIFSTCPQSTAMPRAAYLQSVIDVARWSDDAGCQGILVYTDNSLVDPWLLAQVIIEHTQQLCPLVAVQPVYMHPYSVAKMVATFGHLYNRRIYLNMVAGGFTRDLLALDDDTDHDRRYDRIVEYTTIIKELLAGRGPVSFAGEFYRVDRLKLNPPLPEHLYPGITLSGSSAAGLAAAAALGATAVEYPKPAGAYAGRQDQRAGNAGIRIGIIARPRAADAWKVAWERFPADRRGQLTHQLAMKASDSVWHRQLSQLAEEAHVDETPYWLHPFENYKTFCPYLVGGYDEVASELGRYVRNGFRTFILDIPSSREELDHIDVVFDQAVRGVPL